MLLGAGRVLLTPPMSALHSFKETNQEHTPMRTRIITSTEDATFIAPVKEPVAGWSVRPGTFRVAHPYDKSTISNSAAAATAAVHPNEPDRPHKKQKLSTQGSDSDEEITQWIQSALQLLLGKDATRTHINAIQQDEFYGTFVDAPANEEFTLDLVKAQPTLQLLRRGFQSTSSNQRRNQIDDDTLVAFDNVLLSPDNQQHLEITDVYETLVTNRSSRPAFITFPTEGQPLYLVPPHSAFVASDFGSIQGLKVVARQRGGFDMIVMDPPWQNASVDRMGHYGTFDLYELFKIPIPDLLSPNVDSGEQGGGGGGVVAVWITNRTKVRKVVVEKLFPAWGLELIAQWYWLKVTTRGEPVLNLNNKHRRPYEGILIGRRKTAPPSPVATGTALPGEALAEIVPKRKLIVSVPSQHSRKPSIMDLLSEEYFLNPQPANSTSERLPPKAIDRTLSRRLELFSRTLEEGVLSWGNEPFKYQYCGRGSAPLVQDGYFIPTSNNSSS